MPPIRPALGLMACAAFLSLLASLTVSAAEPDLMAGIWDQIESDAGACPACTVEILKAGESARVRANNGWSALVGPAGGGLARGEGRWSSERPGPYAGRRFAAAFSLSGGRLHMLMTLDAGAPRRIVRAVYRRRGWIGV